MVFVLSPEQGNKNNALLRVDIEPTTVLFSHRCYAAAPQLLLKMYTYKKIKVTPPIKADITNEENTQYKIN